MQGLIELIVGIVADSCVLVRGNIRRVDDAERGRDCAVASEGIAARLGCLYYAVPLYVMSPLSFLVRPESWLWAIHRFRATLSVAPNFAYELCLNKIDDERLKGLDFSCPRATLNGAEPVSVPTLRRFTERFAHYGFPADAMAPVYGLAENSVGLAFPPPGRMPVIDHVDREALTRRGIAEPAKADGQHRWRSSALACRNSISALTRSLRNRICLLCHAASEGHGRCSAGAMVSAMDPGQRHHRKPDHAFRKGLRVGVALAR